MHVVEMCPCSHSPLGEFKTPEDRRGRKQASEACGMHMRGTILHRHMSSCYTCSGVYLHACYAVCLHYIWCA